MMKALFLPASRVVTHVAHATDAKPNTIHVMADDMGFPDIGPYAGDIQTPKLDKLAAGGVRISRF